MSQDQQIDTLSAKAQTYLHKLCIEIPSRRVGSVGNQAAARFFEEVVASFGFTIETPVFECMDWHEEGVDLRVGGVPFRAFASPYSNGCRVQAPLRVVTTVDELAAADLAQSVVLLRGAITGQQLMPKNFPFYNPDEHKQIIHLLETRQPLAIIAATGRDPQMAGSLYPFPLIEDGDFDIPSVYMTDEAGSRLSAYAGQSVSLESRARRIPSTGWNVIAHKGSRQRRVAYFAHIDAKPGTPGAIDNASGVVTLLLLAELLAGYSDDLGIEVVALNGEDYYSSPGEQQYLACNTGHFEQIRLGVNLDGVGYQQGRIAYSRYDCPDEISRLAQDIFARDEVLVEGEQWYQGDHVLFLLNQRPALAFTSERVMELMSDVIHTNADHPGIVDTRKLATLAVALYKLQVQMGSLDRT